MDKSYEARMRAKIWTEDPHNFGDGTIAAISTIDGIALAREMDAERAAKDSEIARLKAALEAREAECDYVKRVVTLGREHDIDFLWRVEDGQIRAAVGCNDTFWWASADAEDVTPENIELLETTLAEVAALPAPEDELVYWQGVDLFVSRIRKMRPQGALYESLWPELAALFDAAGPEREPPAIMGNTARRAYKPRKEREAACRTPETKTP